MTIPRPEYPRPDFTRSEWLNLNGPWAFEFDDDDKGMKQGWFRKPGFSKNIIVPFPFQSENSGIGEKGFHDVFWYHSSAEIPPGWKRKGRIILHIGAFDYHGFLWVNGFYAGEHQGGYTPWDIDITPFVKRGKIEIVIRGIDTQSKSQPRGKQHWDLHSSGIQYTRVSGAWQTIWLEHVPDCFIHSMRIIPVLDPDRLQLKFKVPGDPSKARVSVAVSDGDREIAGGDASLTGSEALMEIAIPSPRRWCPEDPFLYHLSIRLYSGKRVIDEALSYAGIRQVQRDGRALLLNNQPVRFKAVLDQGYFPGGIYTPSCDEDLRRDIEMTKKLGFNGARKHQKVEDPRWYYWCDRMGLLVWAEMGNAWEFTPQSCEALLHEWPEAMRRDWNHPSIIAWVPINESWGVPQVAQNPAQQAFQTFMARLTRELDPFRLVVDNSGWTHTDTDIIDLHPYTQEPQKMAALLEELLKTGQGGTLYDFPVWAGEGKDKGQPIVISEYGGIGLVLDQKEEKDWGYGNLAKSPQDLAQRFRDLTQAILKNPRIAGYAYTQLTDVEQEKNGLLTYDRQPKARIEDFAKAQTE